MDIIRIICKQEASRTKGDTLRKDLEASKLDILIKRFHSVIMSMKPSGNSAKITPDRFFMIVSYVFEKAIDIVESIDDEALKIRILDAIDNVFNRTWENLLNNYGNKAKSLQKLFDKTLSAYCNVYNPPRNKKMPFIIKGFKKPENTITIKKQGKYGKHFYLWNGTEGKTSADIIAQKKWTARALLKEGWFGSETDFLWLCCAHPDNLKIICNRDFLKEIILFVIELKGNDIIKVKGRHGLVKATMEHLYDLNMVKVVVNVKEFLRELRKKTKRNELANKRVSLVIKGLYEVTASQTPHL